jgi:hypothetical protein
MYTFLSQTTMVAVLSRHAAASAFLIDLDLMECSDLKQPTKDLAWQGIAPLSEQSFLVIGSTEIAPQALYEVDFISATAVKKLRAASK